MVGDVFIHSTDSTNGATSGVANVIWTAPQAGTADLSGTIWMALDNERYNDWTLLLEGADLTSGSVSSGDAFDRANPMDFALGSGGASALSDIVVSAGDVIELLITHDSTQGEFVGVSFAVTFTEVPEPSHALLLVTGALVLLGAGRLRPARARAHR